jgi:hypothetical protein
MIVNVGRRQLLAALGGAAVTWPVLARAQRGDRVRRVGVLVPYDENDPLVKTLVSAFIQALCGLGLDRWPQRAVGPSVVRQ